MACELSRGNRALLGIAVSLSLGFNGGDEAGNYDIEILPACGNEFIMFRLDRETGVVVGTQVDVEDDGEEFEWTGWRKFYAEAGVDVREDPGVKPMNR